MVRNDEHRLTGSRALCVSRGHLLLVKHHVAELDLSYWVLPGGGSEAGETFAETAVREVWEETGVPVEAVRRLYASRLQPDHSYALILVNAREHRPALPTVNLDHERYLREAAWWPVTRESPIGPLHAPHWGYLGRYVRWLLTAGPAS